MSLKTVMTAVGTAALTISLATSGAFADAPPAAAKKKAATPAKVAAAEPAAVDRHEHSRGGRWHGPYIGINAGAGFVDSGSVVELAPALANDIVYNQTGGISNLSDQTNFVFGMQVGYNIQINQMVLGIEADLSHLGYNVSSPQVNPVNGALLAGGDTIGSKRAAAMATIRGKVGFGLDRALIYFTGGLAISDLHYSILDACNTGVCGGGLIDGNTSARYGVVYGGGIEFALNNNWSIKGEYLLHHFDGAIFRGTVGNAPGFRARYQADDTDIAIARIGLNYRFDRSESSASPMK